MSKSIDTPVEKKTGLRSLLRSGKSASLRHEGEEQNDKDTQAAATSVAATVESEEKSEPTAKALSSNENEILQRCEERIRGFKLSFMEAGKALQTINAQRLYREHHGDFASYCRHRWAFTPQRADQLIRAAEVAIAIFATLPKAAEHYPDSEGQMRPLTRLREVADAPLVWEKAAGIASGKRVTAALLAKTISEEGFALKHAEKEKKPASVRQVIKRIHDFVDSVRDRFEELDLSRCSEEDRESMRHGATVLLELAESIEIALAGDCHDAEAAVSTAASGG